MRLVFGCMPLDPRILKCCHDCCFVLCVDEVRLSEDRLGQVRPGQVRVEFVD